MHTYRESAQGFTLIDLLIVIAIIGILITLILAAVSRGRDKAHDTRIKSSLSQLRYLAEAAYDSGGATYYNWTTRTDQTKLELLEADIEKNNGVEGSVVMCDEQTLDYCISAPQRSQPSKYYCIDGEGNLKQTSDPCACADRPLKCRL